MGTLYLFYHDAILAAGYILLLIVAFLNLNRMLAFVNRAVEAQAATLTDVNASLEGRVSEQVEKMERLARLKRFLPREITDLITSEGKESPLQSHRGYISCLFCDIRRFTSMTESVDPRTSWMCFVCSMTSSDGWSCSIRAQLAIGLVTARRA